MGAVLVLAAVTGLVIGSFANVCIYRLPRRESVSWPPSHCPRCGRRLGAGELVPVAGFLWQRGRCRGCDGRISPVYPAVELATAVAFVALVLRFGPTMGAVYYAVLLTGLLIATVVDLQWQIIPNRLVLTLACIGGAAHIAALAGMVRLPVDPLPAVVGAAAYGGLMALLVALARGGMGAGDAKLAIAIGLYCGWPAVAVAFFGAFVSGALTGLGLLVSGRKGRREAIPFGPFLALGALAAVFWGQRLVDWYGRLWYH